MEDYILSPVKLELVTGEVRRSMEEGRQKWYFSSWFVFWVLLLELDELLLLHIA
jgi:hypothetical protein